MQAEKTFTRSSNSALKILTVFLVSTSILSVSLHAEIINVPDDFETIQAAINESEDGDTVLVQPGEYVENIDFEGKDIVVMGNPDDPSEVVIDGDENGSVVTFENEESHDAVLTGFTITNGLTDESGGGIYCIRSNPTINFCIITNNQADGSGGGAYCNGNPVFNNCHITNNISSGTGGGVWCRDQANVELNYCVINENASGRGGGIATYVSATVIINFCEIRGNTSQQYAPAIRLDSQSQMEMRNCTVVGNNTNQHRGEGGIHLHVNTQAVITNSIIRQNEDVQLSFYNDSGSATLAYNNIQGGQDNIVNGEIEWGEGNIDENPLFVDPDDGDYHLTADSPCIDAGDPDSDPDPDGTRADMGAYYFHQIGQYIDVPDDFETIQEAIDASEDGDTVLVHSGTYIENIDFIGKDIVVGSLFLTTENAAYVDSTIIDGNSNGSVVTLTNEETEAAELAGFTIQNGNSISGGGIFCIGSNPTLSHLIITENDAEEVGGGIYCANSDLSITDCVITGNTATDGAGIGCVGSNLTMAYLDINDNDADFQAGAIYCNQSQSTLTRSVLCGNRAGERCGGIVLDSISTMDVTSVTFTLNWAGMVRCGIHLRAGSEAVIANTIFWRNYPAEICFGEGDRSVITISHCDVEEGEDGIIGDGDVNWLEGNIDEDPLFADPDEGDFNLTAGSPCVDVGTPLFVWQGDTLVNIPPDDYLGNAPDMGAFESEFTVVDDDLVKLPDEFRLYPAFPNPFNSSTELRFDLPSASDVTLKIYDLMGREVLILTDDQFVPGRYRLTWNASDIPSGIYLAQIEASGYKQMAKLVLVR